MTGFSHAPASICGIPNPSSLDGAAVVAVRIKGARHEYATVNGVEEDVVNILLNLKKLRVRLHGEGPETLLISLKGKKEVKASN